MTATATALPTWVKPDNWVCHLPSKTVFQPAHCRREKTTGQMYLTDLQGETYPLADCAEFHPSQLANSQGVMLIGDQVADLRTEGNLLILTCGARRIGITWQPKSEPERDEVLDAALTLANAFEGVITHGEELEEIANGT